MSTEVDLQAQMVGESSRQFLAYTIFRDMGEGRTMKGSYPRYIEAVTPVRQRASSNVIGKSSAAPSKTYAQWARDFKWEERVRDWDDRKMQRVQAAQLEADTKGYCERVEKMRQRLERCGILAAETAEAQFIICQGQINAIGKKALVKGDDGRFSSRILDKADAALFAQWSSSKKMAIDSLAAAKMIWEDSLGLVEIIKSIEGDGS